MEAVEDIEAIMNDIDSRFIALSKDGSRRGKRFRVRLVDAAYYREIVSCQAACPVHTDASSYVRAVASGNIAAGYYIARQPNPLASVCGRVCAAPCETACRRGKIDAPITIRALKRYLCERYGTESQNPMEIMNLPAETDATLTDLGNVCTTESLSSFQSHRQHRLTTAGDKVAVIGAGPAGLTAAHDLAAIGYETTIFEAGPAPGGMLLLGVPAYRLPREVLKSEIDSILAMGVELRLNTCLGREISLGDLEKEGFRAVFIATGAHRDVRMGLPGEDLAGVISGIEFLRKVNLGQNVSIGQTVAVVGGGNVAMDSVRTALRLGEDETLALDSVRTASRLGAKKALVLYRRSREEMPASEVEILEAAEEGIEIFYQVAPVKIIGDEGKVTGVECIRMTLGEPDSSGRRRPVPIEGSEFTIEVDTVISATGQIADLSFIRQEDNISVTPSDTIAVDPATLATTRPGFFAGGDVAFGPRIIIEAVRDGHTAARAIEQFLRGEETVVTEFNLSVEDRTKIPPTEILTVSQQYAPVLPVANRKGFREVEQVYTDEIATLQADRCLRCNIQTVFNSDKCILCGGCVDVCPRSCYNILSLDVIEGDKDVAGIIEARFGSLPVDKPEDGDVERGAAIIKDEDNCVRCGLCAERCPTGAITMEAFSFREEIIPNETPREREEI